jgi:hypothetical protein
VSARGFASETDKRAALGFPSPRSLTAVPQLPHGVLKRRPAGCYISIQMAAAVVKVVVHVTVALGGKTLKRAY